MMLTTSELREHLQKTFEYPLGDSPLLRESLLAKVIRKQLKRVDDEETLNVAHDNIAKFEYELSKFIENVEIKFDILTSEDLSERLPYFINYEIGSIIKAEPTSIARLTDQFVSKMSNFLYGAIDIGSYYYPPLLSPRKEE